MLIRMLLSFIYLGAACGFYAYLCLSAQVLPAELETAIDGDTPRQEPADACGERVAGHLPRRQAV